MTNKSPKEIKVEYEEYTPEVIPVNSSNYQDEFLYGKSVEKLRTKQILDPAEDYVLPTATTSVLGGVKVDGTTITIAAGVISATAQPAAVLTQSGTQTITTATATVINTITVAIGTAGMIGTSNRIIASTAGTYMVSARYLDASGGSTGARTITIKKNGSNFIINRFNAGSGTAITPDITFPMTLALNDYIELAVYQDSGSDMTVSDAFMSAVKII